MDFKLAKCRINSLKILVEKNGKSINKELKDEKGSLDRAIFDKWEFWSSLVSPGRRNLMSSRRLDFQPGYLPGEGVASWNPSISCTQLEVMIIGYSAPGPIWKFGTLNRVKHHTKPLAEVHETGVLGLHRTERCRCIDDALNGSGTVATKNEDGSTPLNGLQSFQ